VTKQAKLTKTSQKTSEVEDLQNPETKAAERRVGQQRDVPKRITKSPPGGSLPRHTEKLTEKSTAKSPSQVLPTCQKTSGMQSTETHTEKSTKKSTKILLKPPIESAPMKLTGWSSQRTSIDDYLVKQHLAVNATYR